MYIYMYIHKTNEFVAWDEGRASAALHPRRTVKTEGRGKTKRTGRTVLRACAGDHPMASPPKSNIPRSFALPEENTPIRGRHNGQGRVDVPRARPVPGELHVVVEDDVRQRSLEHVRREEPPWAAEIISKSNRWHPSR